MPSKMKFTDAERAGLIIGSAGLFIIAIAGVLGMLVLAYQRKTIPVAIGVVVGTCITGGIDSLRKIGDESRSNIPSKEE